VMILIHGSRATAVWTTGRGWLASDRGARA
jgi:hypothetical protein